MKQLKDLKDDILANKINKFYVFYGPDYGLRKHYIDKLAESCDKVEVLEDTQIIEQQTVGKGLFKMSKLYVVYNDTEFAQQSEDQIRTFINRLSDDIIIMDYEDELGSSNLFKMFSEYITYFPRVSDNIAKEFVKDLVSINIKSTKNLIFNCSNDYNNIVMESDKIKQYSDIKNVNQQIAYDDLNNKEQLIERYPDFNIDQLMNDVLTQNSVNYPYWIQMTQHYKDDFWLSLNRVFTDFLTAYLVVTMGPYKGSSEAYNMKLPWNRAKVIRELPIKYKPDELLKLAYKISEIDLAVKTGNQQTDNLFVDFLCRYLR